MPSKGLNFEPFFSEFPHLFAGRRFISLWVGEGWFEILWTLCSDLESLARQRAQDGQPPLALL